MKKRKTIEDLKSAEMKLLPLIKKSLSSMIAYLENPEYKRFYRELLNLGADNLGPSSSSTRL